MTLSSLLSHVGGMNIYDYDDTPKYNIGMRLNGDYGGQFVYCRFTEAVKGGDVVAMNGDYDAVRAGQTSVRGTPLGTVRSKILTNPSAGVYTMASFPAGSYGWVQVAGTAPVRVGASCAANTALNFVTISSTNYFGIVDDDATAGQNRAVGITTLFAAPSSPATTADGSVVEGVLLNPSVGGPIRSVFVAATSGGAVTVSTTYIGA